MSEIPANLRKLDPTLLKIHKILCNSIGKTINNISESPFSFFVAGGAITSSITNEKN